MEELYLIMRDFLEVQYHQNSILCVLDTLEDAYSEEEQAKIKMTIHVLKTYMEFMYEETKMAISRFDAYIAEK
ncbi:MAG: hypothetical protein K2K70_06540 [Lachnospiraceae bacterium]|nr:hypothetical protein [Lachnospiraceae bacterium]